MNNMRIGALQIHMKPSKPYDPKTKQERLIKVSKTVVLDKKNYFQLENNVVVTVISLHAISLNILWYKFETE